ncbi:tetratricopeptide repeat protein [Vibrio sp. TH_r3]|uniref:tetratricopeptide repeat protein n=1 Tax=Vibrio sp. TH_r3 TaxID=3082084 RepID=UPI002954854A|nr:tetratricopeptide repeat protein [Vibrio sp. TH_r3]MDV7104842.1 tetratricopeptide repeat protein [Vibrio sp. TH_r3]
MNFITIAIGSTVVFLVIIFGWMLSLSAKKKRLVQEKSERDRAYKRAIERQRNEEKKERQFKAETGHIPTQLFLAKEAELQNPREALYWYEQAALQGNEMGMFGVVRVCARAKDDIVLSEKSKFWKVAIEAYNGNKRAKFEMGKALLGGKGTEQDIDKGIAAIEDVANEDNIDAQIYMGDWYIAESNMQPNPKLSAEWHFKAAQQNSIEGQLKLGEHYRDGIGVDKNIRRATYWFERAAEQADPKSQFYAGDIWVGRGAKGNAIAYIWLFLSAYFGYEPAKLRRDDVGNLLGVDAVVALQGMAKPLLKKFASGAIEKHSMIKTLNKLYKRETYFPDIDGNEFMVYESQATDKDTETPKKSDEKQSHEPFLDYSSSPMDKNNR